MDEIVYYRLIYRGVGITNLLMLYKGFKNINCICAGENSCGRR